MQEMAESKGYSDTITADRNIRSGIRNAVKKVTLHMAFMLFILRLKVRAPVKGSLFHTVTYSNSSLK